VNRIGLTVLVSNGDRFNDKKKKRLYDSGKSLEGESTNRPQKSGEAERPAKKSGEARVSGGRGKTKIKKRKHRRAKKAESGEEVGGGKIQRGRQGGILLKWGGQSKC